MDIKFKPYTMLHEHEIDCLINNVNDIPEGIIVCAGTWNGGDLMSMINVQPDKYYIVIDSFNGLNKQTEKDFIQNEYNNSIKEGMFSIKGKDNYIQNFKEQNIRLPDEIYEMWVSDITIKNVKVQPIAMLWLDLDLYESTLSCLSYFKDYIVKDGIILVHDYSLSETPGIKLSCNKYFDNWEHQIGGIWKTKI